MLWVEVEWKQEGREKATMMLNWTLLIHTDASRADILPLPIAFYITSTTCYSYL